jgi:hypothetical protein
MNSDSLNSFSNPEIVCISFSFSLHSPFKSMTNSAILDPHNYEKTVYVDQICWMVWQCPLGIDQPFVRCTFPNQGKIQPVLVQACDLSCSDSPGCEPRHREYGDPRIVGLHRGCRMGSLVAMRRRIGLYSDRRRTIERGFGLGLSVVVVALPIGWFRTVLRCGSSSGVGTLAQRFSLVQVLKLRSSSILDPTIFFSGCPAAFGSYGLSPPHVISAQCQCSRSALSALRVDRASHF